MATKTTNYSLVKPAGSEAVDVSAINGNMDIIDSELHGHSQRIDSVETVAADVPGKLNKPATNPNGTSGQVLRTNGNGTTYWDDAPDTQEIASSVENWLNKYIPKNQTVVVDASLNTSGAAADAKVTGDKFTLHQDLMRRVADSYYDPKGRSVNLFDKDSSQNVFGEYYNPSSIVTNADQKYGRSHPIFVLPGNYKFNVPKISTYGSNGGLVMQVDSQNHLIKRITSTYDSTNGIATFSVQEACYVSINITTESSSYKLQMFCLESQFPATYVSGSAQTLAKQQLVAALMDRINSISSSKNLFNANSPDNTHGRYRQNNGSLATGQSSSYFTTHPILIAPGTYKFNVAGSTFGVHSGIVAVINIQTGGLDKIIDAQVNSNDSTATFTCDEYCFVEFNMTDTYASSAKFCLLSDWQDYYIPFREEIQRGLLNLAGFVQKEDTTFFENQRSENLIDLSEKYYNKYFAVSGSSIGSLQSYTTSYSYFSLYVRLDGSGTYSTRHCRRVYGESGKYILLFNKDKEYVARLTGTLSDPSANVSGITFVVTEDHIRAGAYYFGLVVEASEESTIMAVKSATYPSSYIPYVNKWIIPDQTVDPLQVEGLTDSLAEAEKVQQTVFSRIGTYEQYLQEPVKQSHNLFDPTATPFRTGAYMTNGEVTPSENENYAISSPIFVAPGQYKYRGMNTFGSNGRYVAVIQNNEIVKILEATQDTSYEGDGIYVFTIQIDEPCYLAININTNFLGLILFAAASNFIDPRIGRIMHGDEPLATESIAVLIKKENEICQSSVNLFNKNDPRNREGTYISFALNSTTVITEGGSSNYVLSHPIFVTSGTYKFTKSTTFGSNGLRVGVVNSQGDLLRDFAGTEENGIVSFQVDQPCFVVFNTQANRHSSIMFCKADQWPESYVPFSKTIDNQYMQGVVLGKENTDYFVHTVSENLFNYQASDLIDGKYFNPTGGGLNDNSNDVSQYIPIKAAGTYYYPFSKGRFGSNANIPLYDKNKGFLKTASITQVSQLDTNIWASYFTISEADLASVAYAGFTTYRSYMQDAMFVRGSFYPSSYIPFADDWTIPSLVVDDDQIRGVRPSNLYGKTAVFDGDSICQASTDRSNKGAWAGRIALNNSMRFKNYGVGGGTFTSELYYQSGNPRHWVSTSIDTVYSEFPDADYVILEGGTNDADLIGNITTGNTPEKFGSFTATDFSGNYDKTTFCGAVEHTIFKAISYWPTAKIGMIIAPKMGTDPATSFANRKAYFNTVMEICKKWGIPYINLWDECPMNPILLAHYDPSLSATENIEAHKLYTDGQHPTPTGYDYITPKIEAWMETL